MHRGTISAKRDHKQSTVAYSVFQNVWHKRNMYLRKTVRQI